MKPRSAGKFVYEFLKNGASADLNIDGSTPVNFTYTVPASKTLILARFNFALVDGSMTYGKFGGLTALTNGLKLEILDTDGSTQLLDFTGGLNIKTNEDFACLAGVDAIAEPAAGDDFMPIRFTVNKAGAPMLVHEGQVIRLVVQDNLSALSHFRCMVQGIFDGQGIT